MSCWPVTLPAQNSWFFKRMAGEAADRPRRAVGERASISASSIRSITSTSWSSACVQEHQVVHRGSPRPGSPRARSWQTPVDAGVRRCQTDGGEPAGRPREPAARPRPPSSGASRAVSEVASLVRSRPLVTLTGVGGVGQDPARPRGRRRAGRGVPRRRVAGRAGAGRRPRRGPRRDRHRPRHHPAGRCAASSTPSPRRWPDVACWSWSTTASTSSRRPPRPIGAILARSDVPRVLATSREHLRAPGEALVTGVRRWPWTGRDVRRGDPVRRAGRRRPARLRDLRRADRGRRDPRSARRSTGCPSASSWPRPGWRR